MAADARCRRTAADQSAATRVAGRRADRASPARTGRARGRRRRRRARARPRGPRPPARRGARSACVGAQLVTAPGVSLIMKAVAALAVIAVVIWWLMPSHDHAPRASAPTTATTPAATSALPPARPPQHVQKLATADERR